ncbi:hypothetical protein SAMN05421644_11818 [Allochromatium warmingii]|uniref:Uncharacterized protein n=1 Tax=Allochromatium warmingii TaxID=61595 RepID=A0A1H3FEX5_ALLWA|nr:hypothetical protein SAMN05421644_11818 [Allochromatium warmingii]
MRQTDAQESVRYFERTSEKDRIVYKFDSTYIYIFAIGGHYDSSES